MKANSIHSDFRLFKSLFISSSNSYIERMTTSVFVVVVLKNHSCKIKAYPRLTIHVITCSCSVILRFEVTIL